MTLTDIERQALAALDEAGLLRALRELVCIPSLTGREAEAQCWLGEQMRAAGLDVDLWTIDVEELQRRSDFPGMEVERADVRVAHMPDERVLIEEIVQAARAYILVALRYLS